jgi:hypothetical protein
VFLAAILVALAITLVSVSPSVRLLAGSVVTPLVVLCLVFLYFEGRRRPWSFVGAAVLGALGVALRLAVNAHPDLEVGGGLPLVVTVVYSVLGTLVAVTSLWAFVSVRRAGRGVAVPA